MKVYIILNDYYLVDSNGNRTSDSRYVLGAALTIEGANNYILSQKMTTDSRSGFRVESENKKWKSYRMEYPKLDWDYTIVYNDGTKCINHVHWRKINVVDAKEP